jgi:transcriptional regulator with XRE-family HTH domain
MAETKSSDKRLLKAGEELRKMRIDADLSSEEVSRRTDISIVRLSHIEDGMDPTLAELFQLADAYGYTPEGLFERMLKKASGKS